MQQLRRELDNKPLGEIGEPGRVGGHEEFNDPQLGIGHGFFPWESQSQDVRLVAGNAMMEVKICRLA